MMSSQNREVEGSSPQSKDAVKAIEDYAKSTAKETPGNLPSTFKKIYFHLYSNSNLPRAERLASEMVRILFCKIYDETTNTLSPSLRIRRNEDDYEIASRLRSIFEDVKKTYPDVFDSSERLLLDDRSIAYVVKTLQYISLSVQDREVVGDAFQVFVGPSLRGEKGQFFTPRNVVRLCVECLDPRPGESVMDPACGTGGFLIVALEHAWTREKGAAADANPVLVAGVDKEMDLVKICKTYMAMIGDGRSRITCTDSLADRSHPLLQPEQYDLVLTNPPFGARIPITESETLANYHLGHAWRRKGSMWREDPKTTKKQAPQVLFIERCLELLKEGGRMAIVIPDGILSNPSDRHIVQFILRHSRILGVVSCPHETFLPSTHTKTSVLFLEKTGRSPEDYPIFMAIARATGHDKNGKRTYKMDRSGELVRDASGLPILDDDFPEIARRFREFLDKKAPIDSFSHLGLSIMRSQLRSDVLVPEFYDPEIEIELERLRRSSEFDLVPIGQLVKAGVLSIQRGNEVGSKFYGRGDVPFVRTTDIVNWEIRIDPIKSVPEEVYEQYRERQDIRENDILFVNDGTFLIGRSAIVTRLDTGIVIQSHLRKIRVNDHEALDPFLLLYLLNSQIVKKQVRSKTFVQATISTLGNRLQEIVLPNPKDPSRRKKLAAQVQQIIATKVRLREETQRLLDLS